MARTQGSLEYLIIITMAIAVLAVVASFVVGYFSTQSDQFYYASCSNAAALCRDTLLIDSNNGCLMCNNACNYSDGTEIFSGAVTCCRLGKPSEIYGGSIGTNCVSAPPVTPPPGPVCLESDGVTVVPEGLCAATKLGKRCVSGVLQPACSSGCLCNNSIYQKCDSSPSSPSKNYCYNISFTETNISNISADIRSIAFGDANNDLNYEIVVGLGSFASRNTTIMYSYSGGSWIENNISDKTGYVYSVAIGNADNLDGNEVVVGGTSGKVRLYNYVGGAWQESVVPNTPPLDAYSVAIGNVDDLPDNELVVGFSPSGGSSEIRVYKYDAPTTTWISNTVTSSLPTAVNSIAIGDANHDGDNEIVAGLTTTRNETRMYKYSTGRWIETNISDEPTTVWTLAVGNADNVDGDDVVVGMAIIPNNTRAYTLSGGLWQEANLTHPNFINLPNPVSSVAIGDIDKDGNNEVIVVYLANGISVKVYWYNPVTGQWPRESINYPAGFPVGTRVTAIGDINKDDTNDIFVGMSSSPTVGFELRSYAPYRIYDY